MAFSRQTIKLDALNPMPQNHGQTVLLTRFPEHGETFLNQPVLIFNNIGGDTLGRSHKTQLQSFKSKNKRFISFTDSDSDSDSNS